MTDIAIVAALAANRVIGRNNALPWRLPADMRRFRALTMGRTVLMGRRTLEAIGRPLPGRTNLVLTRAPDWEMPGCRRVGSIEEVQEEGLMVIGGASIYEQMIPRATRLYLTVIHHAFPGDAFFPPWDEKAFDVVEREDFAPDAENPYPYTFLTLVRKP